MNISVIYGENEVESNKRLNELVLGARKKGLDIRRISPISQIPISDAVSSLGLFENSLLIIEDPGRLNKKEFETIIRLNKGADRSIVFFQVGNLNNTFLKLIPKESSLEEFKLPKYLYKFLDSFYPGNYKASLLLLHKVENEAPDELILHLLAKHLHDLYTLKFDENALKYPDWRMLKLTNQAGKFSVKKLIKLIHKLAKIDIAIKTSKESLIPSLDLVIATELE